MELILVCDDDREIVDAIKIYLSGEGFEVIAAYDGEEAIKLMAKHKVDLLIIDIMMPVLDGIRATMQIRENSTIPIIMLSAKSEDADKILGLNIGADDYLTKPFNPLELVARVKSQLRRYKKLGNMSMPEPQRVVVGDLEIDDETKEVVVAGELIKLTPIEYNILLLLAKNEGKVYSIYDIGGAQGIIGVMGPKRMAYSKTMGLINHVSREVNKLINSMEKDKNKRV